MSSLQAARFDNAFLKKAGVSTGPSEIEYYK